MSYSCSYLHMGTEVEEICRTQFTLTQGLAAIG